MMGRDRHELERKGKLHTKREDTEPYLKGGNNMISLTTNTRGCTIMENFKVKSGPELVAMFNKMAESDLGKELKARPVTRFADTQSGIKRCEALASSIKARKEGLSTKKEEDTMATATKTKKTAAKRAAPEKNNGVEQEKIAQEFEARAGSFREKLLVTMRSSFRKQLTVNQLLKGVYGNMNTENKGALMMCMRGALATIKKNRLPYQIKKEKNAETKEISFGLFPKS